MRKKLLIAAIILLFSFCRAHVPSVEEILRTNQYLLVSQQDSHTVVEANLPPKKCPFMFTKPKMSNQPNFLIVGAHLVRDPEGIHSPKIMLIKEEASKVFIEVFALNVTEMLKSRSNQASSFLNRFNSTGFQKYVYLDGQTLKGSLFDSSNHMLYFDFSTRDKFQMNQYFIQGIFSGGLRIQMTGKYEVPSPSSRYEWSEDHYEQKFYYKELIDNEVHLFAVPMNSFIPTIMDGVAGTKIGTLKDDGYLRGATGGGFVTVSRKPSENLNNSMTTSLIPSNFGAGMSCRTITPLQNLPKFQSFFVIRNNDFCMLRDGAEYSRELCEEEQKQYLVDIGEGPSDSVKWLLILCIFLFMLNILLFVYIYWLRSTFISENDRTHPNEYETEASLFVAKQRSFPSAYQDPALMDVSVDRWN